MVKVPKDFLVLHEDDESGGQPTVVAMDSFFKVVDADGNEKTILVKQGEPMDDEEGYVNPEEAQYKEVDLTTFYVSADGDEQTFVLNQ